MMDHRTKKQIAADALDLEVFRLCRQLYQFAGQYGDKDIVGMSLRLDTMRYLVRRHMDKQDEDRTSFNIRPEEIP
jgi:hypothetical protein